MNRSVRSNLTDGCTVIDHHDPMLCAGSGSEIEPHGTAEAGDKHGVLKLSLPQAVIGPSDLADEISPHVLTVTFGKSLTVIDAVRRYFQDYAGFWGRTSREDFWWVALFTALVVFFSMLIEAHVKSIGADLMALYVCATIVPFTAIGVRRLHDANLSGWWVFVGLVPIVGQLIALVFFLTPGTRGPNRYGDDPRGARFGAAT